MPRAVPPPPLPPGVVSFGVPLRAGTTVIRPHDHSEPVFRPAGMDGWILQCTAGGCGRIGRGPRQRTVVTGELLLFQPRASHDYHAADPPGAWIHHWVYCFPPPAWLPLLDWPEVDRGIGHLDLRGHVLEARILALAAEIVRTWQGRLARREQLVLSLLEELLVRVDAVNPRAGYARLDPRLARALDDLQDPALAALPMPEIARRAGLSASRFAHLFRAQLGCGPRTWRERQRLEHARRLLLISDAPIRGIAASVGVEDAAWFARRFRRAFGLPPQAYRRQVAAQDRPPRG